MRKEANRHFAHRNFKIEQKRIETQVILSGEEIEDD